MSPPPIDRRRLIRKLLLAFLVGVPLWGGAIYYFFVYAGGTRDIVNAYAAAAKTDHPVQPIVVDADSDAARTLFAASQGWSMRNWILNSGGGGTGCIWTNVTSSDGKSTDVAFFVNERDGSWQIARVSAKKSCDCARHTCTMAP